MRDDDSGKTSSVASTSSVPTPSVALDEEESTYVDVHRFRAHLRDVVLRLIPHVRVERLDQALSLPSTEASLIRFGRSDERTIVVQQLYRSVQSSVTDPSEDLVSPSASSSLSSYLPPASDTNSIHDQRIQSSDAGSAEEDDEEDDGTYYLVACSPEHGGNHAPSVVFLKRSNGDSFRLDDPSTFGFLLTLSGFGVGSLFSTLSQIVEDGFIPFLNSYPESSENAHAILALKHNIEAFKTTLIQCEENQAVPEADLFKFVPVSVVEMSKAGNHTSNEISVQLAQQISDAELVDCVKSWIRVIKNIVTFPEPKYQKYSQFIRHWESLCRSLENLSNQLRQPELEQVIKLLENRRQVRIIARFKDTGLSIQLSRAKAFVEMTRDLDFSELDTAADVESIFQVISKLCGYLNSMMKKKSLDSSMKIPFWTQTLELISHDVFTALVTRLQRANLLFTPYQEFERDILAATHALSEWQQAVDGIIRTVFVADRMESVKKDRDLLALKFRLDQLLSLRRRHSELVSTMELILSGWQQVGNSNVIVSIRSLFEEFASSSFPVLLNLSEEGESSFRRAVEVYVQKIDEVELEIVDTISERLRCAHAASEKFRIFFRVRDLLNRPTVRRALIQFQNQLCENLEVDFNDLRSKFRQRYEHSGAEIMSRVHGLPKVSGALIWAKQILRHVDTILERIDVLSGKTLESLKRSSDNFGLWTLRPELTEILGADFEDIVEICQRQPGLSDVRVAGTALVLAFLENAFSHSRRFWDAWVQRARSHISRYSNDGTALREASSIIKSFKLGEAIRRQDALRDECEKFKSFIEHAISECISQWVDDVKRAMSNWGDVLQSKKDSHVISGRIFTIVENVRDETAEDVRSSSSSSSNFVDSINGSTNALSRFSSPKFRLTVNFPDDLFTLVEELHHFQWLGFEAPKDFRIILHAAEQHGIHRYAANLTQSVATLERLLSTIDLYMYPLFADDISNILDLIRANLSTMWGSPTSTQFISDFMMRVHEFTGKVTDIRRMKDAVERCMEQLRSCTFDPADNRFAAILNEIQQILQGLSTTNVPNIALWFQGIHSDLELLLAKRLEAALMVWTGTFRSLSPSHAHENDTRNRDFSSDSPSNVIVHIEPLIVQILLADRRISVRPAVGDVRQFWLRELQNFMSTIVSLPQVEPPREIYLLSSRSVKRGSPSTYRTCLRLVDSKLILEAFQAVEECVEHVARFSSEWTSYQSLWDMAEDLLDAKLGRNLEHWCSLLTGFDRARAQVDSSDAKKNFGAVVVDYQAVQAKVTTRFEHWQSRLVGSFRSILSESMRYFYDDLCETRGQLETISFEIGMSDTIDAVMLLERKMRSKVTGSQLVSIFCESEKLLKRKFGVSFGDNWLFAERVQSEWNVVETSLKRKYDLMQEKLPELQAQIRDEDRLVMARVQQFVSDYEQQRPTRGNMKPGDALRICNQLSERLESIRVKSDELRKAKETLGLESSPEDPIRDCMNDLREYSQVWKHLESFSSDLEDLRNIPFTSVIPHQIRDRFSSMLNSLASSPSWMLTYEPVVVFRANLVKLNKLHNLLSDLRGPSMQERHWKMLKEKNIFPDSFRLFDMTLGMLYDSDPTVHEREFSEVLRQAQGEYSLEEFLRTVAERWNSWQLTLVEFRGKTSLVKFAADDMGEKILEDLASLQAMRMSPFFKPFQDIATTWEEKLSKCRVVFELWMEVQRKYVYLEGVFSGSSDIRQALVKAAASFQQIESHLFKLLRQVKLDPYILNVSSMEDLPRTLEKLLDSLSKIQKSLSDFLESQRSHFPRLYFIGDEDLLEILGHSKEPVEVSKHLRKMFPGIANLVLSPADSPTLDRTDDQVFDAVSDHHSVSVFGVSSAEGETVWFDDPVVIRSDSAVYQWLQQVHESSRRSVAQQTIAAVRSLDAIYANIPSFGNSNDLLVGLHDDKVGSIRSSFLSWCRECLDQVMLLACRISWTERCDNALGNMSHLLSSSMEQKQNGQSELTSILSVSELFISFLADAVLIETIALHRVKFEHLITELVHQRDVVRELLSKQIKSRDDFSWLYFMRYYIDPSRLQDICNAVIVRCANAEFRYGFEYLGVMDPLVTTPLTDRTYLTLTQALHNSMGGSPFGPAGTGKTETVKSLGSLLGKFVLVFNCDENFDFQAMGRIFLGLCMCGAWGCFDEFNRLEERILSAVSQQIHAIQMALRSGERSVTLLSKNNIPVDPGTGIFVTMNPGYAGRSNLPDNLKQLFRSIAMVRPDRELIAEVILFSRGFRTAEQLARKIVPLFELCADQLSRQSHYDFGLRALKSVLSSAGAMKRRLLYHLSDDSTQSDVSASSGMGEVNPSLDPSTHSEVSVLLRAVVDTVIPKLVTDDISLFRSLLSDVFPGCHVSTVEDSLFEKNIRLVCDEMNLSWSLISSSSGETNRWIEKIRQLKQIQSIHHGLMLVGPSGSGKSCAWRVLLETMYRCDGILSKSYVIDAKAISSKDILYGVMDSTTREWTDGVFTALLRRVIENKHNEANARHWIIFDGDVDPEWVENMNSLLDDNRLLTLPNGERLALPSNVRIVFEVQDLRSATLATVSRCGMVWFSENEVEISMKLDQFLSRLSREPLNASETEKKSLSSALRRENILLAQHEREIGSESSKGAVVVESQHLPLRLQRALDVQQRSVEVLRSFFCFDGFVSQVIQRGSDGFLHIMEYTSERVLTAFLSLMERSVTQVIDYAEDFSDFHVDDEKLSMFLIRRLLWSLCWSVGGSLSLEGRSLFEKRVYDLACDVLVHPYTVQQVFPPSFSPGSGSDEHSLYSMEVDGGISLGQWIPYSHRVQRVDVLSSQVEDPDFVVPTLDTVRHDDVLESWILMRRPIILCGPPGSGKTMTLKGVLKSSSGFQVEFLNFSKATQPSLVLKCLEMHCNISKTAKGHIMAPRDPDQWLVLFCDEINLPEEDAYGTQHVIALLRQLVEHGGFWSPNEPGVFIHVERVQIVGACNPPSDPGRVPLSLRFLRHTALLYVDFPSNSSLLQIYGTFMRALCKLSPSIEHLGDLSAEAMVEFYATSQRRFTPDQQPHYIYSPRELSRWSRALYRALRAMGVRVVGTVTEEDYVRLFVHEGLRLFRDRLVTEEERKWTDECIDRIVLRRFSSVDSSCLLRPLLFSNWLSREYSSVDIQELRQHVQFRLKEFADEELDMELVVFDSVLEHVLRIDRVLDQPMGHLLLVGVSGAGKTILSRFVAWNKGFRVFQIKTHRRYTNADFCADLRYVMRLAGVDGEPVAFIFDEGNILDSSFLEYMNALLASGEVPGLFEGDEFMKLLNQCRENSSISGAVLNTESELYSWFLQRVRTNLHVIFTMNPSSGDFSSRTATSPALFNRCVIDWFGNWDNQALRQVGEAFTHFIDLSDIRGGEEAQCERRSDVVSVFIHGHHTVEDASKSLRVRSGRCIHITPRHYLDAIKHVEKIYEEHLKSLRSQQKRMFGGLRTLKEAEDRAAELREGLQIQEKDLRAKEVEAAQKLQELIVNEQLAKEKKETARELSQKVEEQRALIYEQGREARERLARAEPALLEAKEAVRGIRREHLQEVQSLANPPDRVRLAPEAVMLCLTGDAMQWNEIRKEMRSASFLDAIVSFDPSTHPLPDKLRLKVKKMYLDLEDFNFETIKRASRACAPMVSWVRAVVEFSGVLDEVAPLQNKVQELEERARVLEAEADEYNMIIADLEAKIASFKVEYASLIAQIESIKQAMVTVREKVNRSTTLIKSLSGEKSRWTEQSDRFEAEIRTVLGDSLLAGLSIAYLGYFDQQYRSDILVPNWMSYLQSLRIEFREDFSLPDYLISPETILDWHNVKELPNDVLCDENAVMLTRFNRYPLIVDPSGQGSRFLLNLYPDMETTSFLNPDFRLVLERSLRFGRILLIQDVEHFDSLLNCVLNKEVRRVGGRRLIQLPGQEIDWSHTFSCFLSTRDSAVDFPADLCSRVTFVNFTVTPASLQSQCMHRVLKSIAPDIDEQRTRVLRLRGELEVRLKGLQDDLLTSLSESRTNLLENDELVSTLEHLQHEGSRISHEMDEAKRVMDRMDAAADMFLPLAVACSRIFFCIERLPELHPSYEFSLTFYFSLVDETLDSMKKHVSIDASASEKARALMQEIFAVTYQKISRGLLQQDHLSFGVRLAQLRLLSEDASDIDTSLFDSLLKICTSVASGSGILPASVQMSDIGLDEEQLCRLADLAQKHKEFSNLSSTMKSEEVSFVPIIQASEGVSAVHAVSGIFWKSISRNGVSEWVSQVHDSICRALLIRAVRPDALCVALSEVVSSTFCRDDRFERSLGTTLDLDSIVCNECDPFTPLFLNCGAGTNAVTVVEEIVSRASSVGSSGSEVSSTSHLLRKLKIVALGSAESIADAEKSILHAQQTGSWVLLENVHLEPSWLEELEKRIHQQELEQRVASISGSSSLSSVNSSKRPSSSYAISPSYRLFLAAEISPLIPRSLLRRSRVVVLESLPGVRASLRRLLTSSLSPSRSERAPAERVRVHVLLALLHTIIKERLLYIPLGWSKAYEFSDADFRSALTTIDQWLDSLAGTRTNIPAHQIPWFAIRVLLLETVYGGRIDNESDLMILRSLLDRYLCPEAYHPDFVVAEAKSIGTIITLGESHLLEDFRDWCVALPDSETPEWVGLPLEARRMRLTAEGLETIGRALRLRTLLDLEDDARSSATGSSTSRQKHYSSVLPVMESWISLLNVSLPNLNMSIGSRIEDPLYRCFNREIDAAASLLDLIRSNLQESISACRGDIKLSNLSRDCIESVQRDVIPNSWNRVYAVPKDLALSVWMSDFSQRLVQLSRVAESLSVVKSSGIPPINLGHLLYPGAFITATRQAAAHSLGCSLEELVLDAQVMSSDFSSDSLARKSGNEFLVLSIRLESAEWSVPADGLVASGCWGVELPPVVLRWVMGDELLPRGIDSQVIHLPLYLDSQRRDILCHLPLKSAEMLTQEDWFCRGAAARASNL